MNNNAKIAIIIAQISKCFINSTLGSISRFNMDPAHSVGSASKTLNYKDLWLAFHPGAPV